jgi:hypothetical protein
MGPPAHFAKAQPAARRRGIAGDPAEVSDGPAPPGGQPSGLPLVGGNGGVGSGPRTGAAREGAEPPYEIRMMPIFTARTTAWVRSRESSFW